MLASTSNLPFTVYLTDCDTNNLLQLVDDFDLMPGHVTIPVVVYALSTKNYFNAQIPTLVEIQKPLLLTYREKGQNKSGYMHKL